MKLLGKIARIVAGIIFFGMGIYAMVNPVDTFETLTWLWVMSFVVSGVSTIVTCFTTLKGVRGRGLFFFEGVVEILIGLMLLDKGTFFSSIIAINMFQISLLFFGIMRIVGSIEEKDANIGLWWVSLIFGILLLLIGMSSFSSAVTAIVTTSSTVGIGLIAVGISMFAHVFFGDRE